MADDAFPIPEPQALALAWAIPLDRPLWRAAFALDAELGRVVARASEPMLAQIRLAWWRDRLREPSEHWPAGNPLLDLIGLSWGPDTRGLVAMIEGWNQLIGDAPLPSEAIADFAAGRAAPFDRIADTPGAGRRWALVDFAAHASDEAERRTAVMLAGLQKPTPLSTRRARPLAVLDRLAKRALRNAIEGRPAFLATRSDALAAWRVGMTGR